MKVYVAAVADTRMVLANAVSAWCSYIHTARMSFRARKSIDIRAMSILDMVMVVIVLRGDLR